MSLITMNNLFSTAIFTMKKLSLFLLLCVISIAAAMPAHAVLKEQSLGKTLDVLCAELEHSYNEQQRMMQLYEQRTTSQHQQLVRTMQQIDQISLILYSQKRDFTFDMAYACQEATNLYKNSNVTSMPYQRILSTLNSEVERYDSLINVLKNMAPVITDYPPKEIVERVTSQSRAQQQTEVEADSTSSDSTATALAVAAMDSLLEEMDESVREETRDLFLLSDNEQRLRERCLYYATAIRNNLATTIESIANDKHYYDLVTNRLEAINTYALKRYEELRASIFENGGQNYFQVLMSLPSMLSRSRMEINDKYPSLSGSRGDVHSDWRGPVILGTSIFILIYIAIASLLSFVILRWLLPRRIKESTTYRNKRGVIGVACGLFLFSVAISIANSFIYNNFISMAIGITIDFTWLVEVILLSLIIRLNRAQLKAGARAYTPFMLMAFVVIVFRIIFIPNNVVNLIYPPLLLIFTIWQLMTIRRRNIKTLPESDIIFSAISFVTMLISCVLSWAGYTLLAVQIMMWWSFQLACIQTIVCLFYLASLYEKRHIVKIITNGKTIKESEKADLLAKARKGDFINKTWVYDMFVKAILPVMAVLSLLLSVVLAAGLFDMKEIFVNAFFYNFVDKTGMVQLSLYKIVLVGGLFFVFRYINYLGHSFYRYYKKTKSKKNPNYRANLTLANNIISILVWGTYFVFGLIVFQVPKSGISLISAGLATGLGFAMKDILENFIYGLSLMSGRVRGGDYIECDGILGKVETISYQSTQIITLDGSVIAFLNTSLFNKNFKNLTRNHSYEYVKVPVGVAYGVKVDEVREMLINALNKLIVNKGNRCIIQKKQGFKVVFGDFGESSVDLIVTFWVLVEEKIGFVYKVKETIYNTLQQHKIEIPYPQRDIYVRQLPAEQQ